MLQQPVRADDGGGGAIQTWEAVAQLWAAVSPVRGEERLSADAVFEVAACCERGESLVDSPESEKELPRRPVGGAPTRRGAVRDQGGFATVAIPVVVGDHGGVRDDHVRQDEG